METTATWCRKCQQLRPVEEIQASIKSFKLQRKKADSHIYKQHVLDTMIAVLETRDDTRCLECGSDKLEVISTNKQGAFTHTNCGGELVQEASTLDVDFKQKQMSYIYTIEGDFLMREVDFRG